MLSKGKHFVEAVGGEVDYNVDINMEVSIFLISLILSVKTYIVFTLQELCQRVTIHKNAFIFDERPRIEVHDEPISPNRFVIFYS